MWSCDVWGLAVKSIVWTIGLAYGLVVCCGLWANCAMLYALCSAVCTMQACLIKLCALSLCNAVGCARHVVLSIKQWSRLKKILKYLNWIKSKLFNLNFQKDREWERGYLYYAHSPRCPFSILNLLWTKGQWTKNDFKLLQRMTELIEKDQQSIWRKER